MNVIWSATAVKDLRMLRNYIAKSDPTAAAAMAGRIVGAVERLADFPAMGRPGRMPHTRELVIPGTPFFVPYLVTEGRVELVAVIHGAQRWPQAEDAKSS